MEQPTNKKAIIYCRVSTQEQADEGNSLTTQQRICRDYANKNGYEVAHVFVEEGESAKTALRTELQLLLKYCTQNYKEIDALIFYKIDRLSRNTDDYSQLRIFFSKFNIQMLSTSETFENNPVGRFIENTLANVAQFDNDIRSERCRNGMIECVRGGRYVFSAPVGYKNGILNGETNIVIDSSKAPFVKRIFDLVATGLYSQEDVRKIIIKEGLVIGEKTQISKQYFHKLIRNKVYKGVIDITGFKLGGIQGTYEPIISEELFDMVQFVLSKKGSRRNGYDTNNPDFPLRGLILSPEGHKLDGSWSKGNGKQRMPYYRFRGLSGFNTKKDVIEDMFASYLKKFELKDDFVDLLKDSLSINWENRNLSNKQQKKQIEKKIFDLKSKQELIIDKNLKGIIDDDLAKEQLNKIKLEISNLSIKLKDYDGIENIKDVLDYSLDFLKDLSTEIIDLKIKQRKDLQWFLFPEGITYDGEELRTTKTALILDTKKTSCIKKSSMVDLSLPIWNQYINELKQVYLITKSNLVEI